MYYEYFELNQPPFKITPDTSLFFPGGNRGAILNAMIYAITSGEGIVKVVGEVGSGKTMLCRMLSVELPENVEVVYLANPSLSPDNILHAIAFELKLAVDQQDDRLQVMQSLQQYLLKRHAENKQVVVFVEEAQSMPIATLEEIRLLSNLETKQHKLLQIVLFGQPELDQMIAKREIRQLKERITYSFNLGPLKTEEVRDYINTRLRACGHRSGELFNSAAIREITRYSKGLLRRINILADKALLSAYASNTHKVTNRDVRTAARDSEFVAGWQRFRYAAAITCVVVILILAILLIPFGEVISRFKGNEGQTNTQEQHEDVALQENEGAVDNTNVISTMEQEDNVATRYLPQDDTYYNGLNSAGTKTSVNREHSEGAESEQHLEIKLDDNMVSSVKNADKPRGEMLKEQGQTGLADYLLDQDHYARIIEVGESSLTSEETELLIQQLKLLPPETAHLQNTGTECRLCTSIIYRPLISRENL